jgi:transcription antitermination factor NusG
MNKSTKRVMVDELFGELELGSGDKRWAVVRTRSRCEKKLAEYAKRSGVHYYLPQRESVKVYEKSTYRTHIPLFSGYVFVCIDYEDKDTLARTGYVAGFLKVIDQEQLLSELRAINQIPAEKVEAGPEYWLAKGLEVEIISGPFAGVRGVVEEHDKLHELRLQVNILKQAVILKTDPADVKIIGEFEIIETEDIPKTRNR